MAQSHNIIPRGSLGFPGGSDGKESACNAGDMGLIPGLGRSPREGNGYPLQYSCLGNLWTEEPDGLQSMGLQRAGHDSVTKQQQSSEASFLLKMR